MPRKGPTGNSSPALPTARLPIRPRSSTATSNAATPYSAVHHQSVDGTQRDAPLHWFDVSWQWVHTLVTRYEAGGIDALTPRSRKPHSNPSQPSTRALPLFMATNYQLDCGCPDRCPDIKPAGPYGRGVSRGNINTIVQSMLTTVDWSEAEILKNLAIRAASASDSGTRRGQAASAALQHYVCSPESAPAATLADPVGRRRSFTSFSRARPLSVARHA